MGRPSRPVPVLTLLLTALLAWPWNVVLSAAESSQMAIPVRLGAVHAQGTPRVQRVVRNGWWDRQSGSLSAPDYNRDEEEGDDDCPLALASELGSIPLLPCTDPPVPTLLSLVLPLRTAPREHLCRLRC